MHLIKNIKHPFCKLKVVKRVLMLPNIVGKSPHGGQGKNQIWRREIFFVMWNYLHPSLLLSFFNPSKIIIHSHQKCDWINGIEKSLNDGFLDLGSARNILWKKATQIVIFTSFRCLSSSLLKLLRRRARKRFSTMKFPTWVRQRSVWKVRVEF